MKKTLILELGISEQLNIKIKNLSAENLSRVIAWQNYFMISRLF